MTPKTTVTIRVSPDTRQALDRIAGAGHTTTSELAGRVLGEWVAAQAVQQTDAVRAGELVEKIASYAECADDAATADGAIDYITDALRAVADAIGLLAGTAPEEG